MVQCEKISHENEIAPWKWFRTCIVDIWCRTDKSADPNMFLRQPFPVGSWIFSLKERKNHYMGSQINQPIDQWINWTQSVNQLINQSINLKQARAKRTNQSINRSIECNTVEQHYSLKTVKFYAFFNGSQRLTFVNVFATCIAPTKYKSKVERMQAWQKKTPWTYFMLQGAMMRTLNWRFLWSFSRGSLDGSKSGG